jgi:hypothetical protein
MPRGIFRIILFCMTSAPLQVHNLLTLPLPLTLTHATGAQPPVRVGLLARSEECKQSAGLLRTLIVFCDQFFHRGGFVSLEDWLLTECCCDARLMLRLEATLHVLQHHAS